MDSGSSLQPPAPVLQSLTQTCNITSVKQTVYMRWDSLPKYKFAAHALNRRRIRITNAVVCAKEERARRGTLPSSNRVHFSLRQAPAPDGSGAGLRYPPPSRWPPRQHFPPAGGKMEGGRKHVEILITLQSITPHQAACLTYYTTLLRWANWPQPVLAASASSPSSVTPRRARLLTPPPCSFTLGHCLAQTLSIHTCFPGAI